jgi:hypothetical protein
MFQDKHGHTGHLFFRPTNPLRDVIAINRPITPPLSPLKRGEGYTASPC